MSAGCVSVCSCTSVCHAMLKASAFMSCLLYIGHSWIITTCYSMPYNFNDFPMDYKQMIYWIMHASIKRMFMYRQTWEPRLLNFCQCMCGVLKGTYAYAHLMLEALCGLPFLDIAKAWGNQTKNKKNKASYPKSIAKPLRKPKKNWKKKKKPPSPKHSKTIEKTKKKN